MAGFLALLIFFVTSKVVQAQELSLEEVPVATESTLSANMNDATASANKQLIQERTDQDLTVPTSQVTGTLVEFLGDHPVEIRGWNILQVMIRLAVNKGLPANMVVLLLLFPVIATVIAFARYIIGVRSFGVYTPAVLTVALVSLGVWPGLVTFLVVLAGALCLKYLLRRLPLPSLSKTSLILWGVSLLMLFFSLVVTYFGWSTFLSMSIFPLLIIILLSENFTDSQFFTSTRTALKQTAATLILASVCAIPMRFALVQQLVILNPEIMILATLLANVIIGRYRGLRWLERVRFKGLLNRGK